MSSSNEKYTNTDNKYFNNTDVRSMLQDDF